MRATVWGVSSRLAAMTACILIPTMLSSCAEGEWRGGLVEPSPLTPFSQQSQGDSVQWVNDVLEFEYDGHTWRLERDQQEATEVLVYQDNVLTANYEVFWDGGEADVIRVHKDDQWMDVNAEGEVVGAKEGLLCDPYQTDPDHVLYCHPGPMSSGDPEECKEELDAAVLAGNTAIVAGLIAVFLGGPSNKLGLIATGLAIAAAVDWGGKALTYGMCRIGLLEASIDIPSSETDPYCGFGSGPSIRALVLRDGLERHALPGVGVVPRALSGAYHAGLARQSATMKLE